MQFTSPLIKGRLLKRYKRFLADVELDNGQIVTAHCPNTGAMTGCADPGFEVWLRYSDDPKRKLAYTWELARNQLGHWIGINTQNANKLCVEGVQNGVIEELADYKNLKTERKYGKENSRIDLFLSDPTKGDCFVEVKSVTLLDDQLGYFPDAKTTRGAKHLRELVDVVSQGDRAVLLFCVQHSGIQSVSIAEHIDPEYSELFQIALSKGVEMHAYGCKMNQEKSELNQRLPIKLKNNS